MENKFMNPEYLDSISGGDPEMIREIVKMFKDQSFEIFNEMTLNLAKKNYQALGLLAHKAKSSVLIMGMNELAVMLKTLEIQAKEGKETELFESYIIRFKTETEAAAKELEELISNRINQS